jgi:hypothetical protein
MAYQAEVAVRSRYIWPESRVRLIPNESPSRWTSIRWYELSEFESDELSGCRWRLCI